jgi:D-lactate dehydrogenase
VRVAVFSSKLYDRQFLEAANERYGHELVYFEPALAAETAPLASGFESICAFVHDRLDRPVLEQLAEGGTGLVALRSAGFYNVDLDAADELGITVVYAPVYSPHQVYFTPDSFAMIADTTLANISAFERGKRSGNEVAA